MFLTARRSLMAHKIRFALTALSVFLGVGFITGTLVLSDTIQSQFNGLFQRLSAGIDVSIQARRLGDGGDDNQRGPRTQAPVPSSLVAVAGAVDGVQVAEGGITSFTAQLIAPDGKAIPTQAPTIGASWGATDRLYPVTLGEGRKPGPNEIAIDRASFKTYGFEFGDKVDVIVPSGRQSFTLVGNVRFGDADAPLGATEAIFDTATAQRVFDLPDQFTEINIVVEPGNDADAVRDRVAAAVGDGYTVKSNREVTEENQQGVNDFISVLRNALSVFTVITLLVAGFIIANTFSIVIAQRTRELALLRALGASVRQVLLSVLVEALIIGVVSSVAGLGGGYVIAKALTVLMEATGFGPPDATLVFKGTTVAVGLIAGIGVTLVAGVGPALRAGRVSPLEAMRASSGAGDRSLRLRGLLGSLVTAFAVAMLTVGLVNGAAPAILTGALLTFIGVAMLLPLVAGPAIRVLSAPLRLRGVAGQMAGQNAARSPRRTAATAAALMIGLSLVGTAGVLTQSLKASFDASLNSTLTADRVAVSTNFQPFTTDLAAKIRELPDVAQVSGQRTAAVEIDGKIKTVSAVEPSAIGPLFDPQVYKGSAADLAGQGMMVHRNVARDLDWDVGTPVTLTFARTGAVQVTIVGLYDNYDIAGSYLVSLRTLETNVSEQTDELVFVDFRPGVDEARVDAALSGFTTQFPQIEFKSKEEFASDDASQVNALLGLVIGLLFLSILIAFLGITNTLALSVFERTRELGLLRAVGTSARQARRMIRGEALVVSVFGALVGLALGTVFGIAVVKSAGDTLSRLAFPTGVLISTMVVIVVFAVVAAALPARRAANLDVLAAISHD